MKEAIKKTDVIMKGKIISKDSFSKDDHNITGLRMSYVKYTVVVSEIIKGKMKSKKIIIATAPGGAGDCGYLFEVGKTYMIFAGKHTENKKDKFLYTSICTKTSKFNKTEFNKIKEYCRRSSSS